MSKKHPSGKTSTASKRKYNERVYTRIDFAIPKDLAAQFWVKCHMNNVSMRSVIMDFMKLYMY